MNGAVTTIVLTVDLLHSLADGDVMHVHLPENVVASSSVNCTANLAEEVYCESSEVEVAVTFEKVIALSSELTVKISGIKNPPSARNPLPFVNLFTRDKYGFDSQTAVGLNSLILISGEPAAITNEIVAQETEEYGQVGKVTLQFTTVNPISQYGVMVLEWPTDVKLYPETYCAVTTHKQILRQNTCTFDLTRRTLTIRDAFVEVPPSYFGSIQISLSKVKNPDTNQNLGSYTLLTYDDPDMRYKVDKLSFHPVM